MATTNIPWQIDACIRRRFELKFYISLPSLESKINYFKNELSKKPELSSIKLTEDDINEIGKILQYWNFKEINFIIKELQMHLIKQLINTNKFIRFLDDDGILKYTICDENDQKACAIQFSQIPNGQFKYPALAMEQIISILNNFKPLASKLDLDKYEEFTENFGILE
eukprot:TRINITY_DN14486_c0_g1_i1.p2 TRINITY_DN14486_c0_g1~~TRINITY_DN14486_c0_g1_i1.p2  ORF type:complete len:168 (+),score=38.68 TRINITY_DN14486_c0_g1_i1:197-700(+)